MSVIKWFRKYNKRMMIGIGVFLMVGFGLPTTCNQMGPGANAQKQTLASLILPTGKQLKITNEDLYGYNRRLDLLRIANVPYLYSMGFFFASSDTSFGPVHRTVELLAFQLFFAGSAESQQVQAILEQEASGLVDTEDEFMELRAAAMEITNAQGGDSGMLFCMLLEEAQAAGVRATQEQVDYFMSLRGELVGAGLLPPLEDQVSQSGTTVSQVRGAVEDYLSILLYADAVTRAQVFSRPQLEQEVLNDLCMDRIEGKAVTLEASLFVDQIVDPEVQALEALFEQYRAVEPGTPDDDNPHGFGYMLDDRVQVEMLRIDMIEFRRQITDELAAMPAGQREEALLKFWENDKSPYQRRQPPPPGSDPATTPPTFTDPPFDEVLDQVKQGWIRSQALERAERVLGAASGRVTRVSPESDFTDEQQAAIRREYEALAPELSGQEGIEVAYVKSDFLSRSDLANDSDFSHAYSSARPDPTEDVALRLMESEPIYQGVRSIHGQSALRFLETIGPVYSYSSVYQAADAKNVSALSLMRLIHIDKARKATSLRDDGRAGPAEVVDENAELTDSALYHQVLEDYKLVEAFALTKRQAQIIATEALAGDWDEVLEQTNISLLSFDREPNEIRPYMYRLRSVDLGQLRQRSDQLQTQLVNMQQQMQQQGPTMTQQQRISYSQSIQRSRDSIGSNFRQLQNAVKAYLQAGQRSLLTIEPVLELPEEMSVVVYQDISLELPTEEDYLQRRPFTAQSLLERDQSLAVLNFYNPNHIRRRLAFEDQRELSEEASGPGEDQQG